MKINRPIQNILPPASAAQGTERTVFGSVLQSDDLNDNLTPSFLRGWGIVDANNVPPKQWFNAMLYTLGGLIAHIYQNGIPIWAEEQEYYEGSVALYDGAVYISLLGDEATPNIGNTPPVYPNIWEQLDERSTKKIINTDRYSSVKELSSGKYYVLGNSGVADLPIPSVNTYITVDRVDLDTALLVAKTEGTTKEYRINQFAGIWGNWNNFDTPFILDKSTIPTVDEINEHGQFEIKI